MPYEVCLIVISFVLKLVEVTDGLHIVVTGGLSLGTHHLLLNFQVMICFLLF